MKKLTKKEVENALLPNDCKKLVSDIASNLEEKITNDEAASMFLSIMEPVKDLAEKCGWDMYDKILFAVKYSYIGGVRYGFDIAFESNRMGIDTLFQDDTEEEAHNE